MTRFHRQEIFEPFGKTGQERLAGSRVMICGCGTLGGSGAAILARAGTGFLRLMDDDIVTFDNLHRQFLFNESDAKTHKPKVVAAANALRAADSNVAIEPIRTRLTIENGNDFVSDVDLLIDGTDNFPSRFVLNDLALRHGKPLVSGGVTGMSGQVFTVLPGQTPCLGCVFGPSPPPSHKATDEAEPFPVLSPIVQVVSANQATEAIKILSGNIDRVSRAMIVFDLWNNSIRQFSFERLVHEPCPRCLTK